MLLPSTVFAVEELLDDPIAHLLMARDGIEPEQVWAHVNDAANLSEIQMFTGRDPAVIKCHPE